MSEQLADTPLALQPWAVIPGSGPLALRVAAGLLRGLLAARWPAPALHGTVVGVRLSASIWGLGFALCFRAVAWEALAHSSYGYATGDPTISQAILLLAFVVGWLIGTVCLSPVGRLNWPAAVGGAPLAGMLGGLLLAAEGLRPGRSWLVALIVLPFLCAWLGLGLAALFLRRGRRLGAANLVAALLATAGLVGLLATTPSLLWPACGDARGPLGRGLALLLQATARDPGTLQLARLHTTDLQQFRSAAGLLTRLKPAGAVAALLAALQRGDDEIQRAAIEALRAIGTPEALDGLRAAQKDLPPSLRYLAGALTLIPSDRRPVSPAARAAMALRDRGGWVERVRRARRSRQPLVPVLLDLVRRGPTELRPWARLQLRTAGRTERAALKRALADPNPEVQLAALLAAPAAISPTPLLRARDARVRAAAVRLVRDRGQGAAQAVLRALLRTDPDPRVRLEAARSLNLSDNNRGALRQAMLHDPVSAVRAAAAGALDQAAVVPALASSDPDVSRSAYRSLVRDTSQAKYGALAARERRRRIAAMRRELGE